MLATQIQYWNLKESERHNVVTEKETVRHNITTEKETERSNRESEKINWFNAHENQRHNFETESLGRAQLAEQMRHNVATEKLGWASLQVDRENAATNRMNAYTNARNAQTNAYMATLREREISNNYALGVQSNNIASFNAQTNRMNAFTNQYNAQTGRMQAESQIWANEQRANVDWYNAATRASELELKRKQYTLDESKFQWQRHMDNTNVLLHIGDTTANTAVGITKAVMAKER